jgi:hypothetical protein
VHLHRSLRRSIATGAATIAVLTVIAAPAQAAAPSVETWTINVDRPYLSCDGFDVNGVWTISHKLTFFFDASGLAIRDIDRVDFSGRFVNSVSGASVPDSGAIIYFDTLAADGSYLTTYSTQVRHSAYIHSAGRVDFQKGTFDGRVGESADGVAALCAALGE